MIREPSISVVIPVFNTNVFYLDKCFNSLNNQTYDNLEIVIVDSSTSLETIKFIQSFKFRFNKVKILKSNCGVSLQRNVGIEQSESDYISFVDSDDYLNENYFKSLIDPILKQDYDISFPIIKKVLFDNGVEVKTWEFKHPDKNALITEDTFFSFSKRNAFVHPIKIYKKSIVGDTRFDETLKYGEDLIFNYRISSKHPDVILCPESIYYYTAEANSNLVLKHFDKSFFNFLKQVIAIHKSKKTNKSIQKDIMNFYNLAFLDFYYSVFKKCSLKWIFLSIRFRFFYFLHNISFYNFVYMFFPVTLFLIKKVLKKV